MSRQADLPAVFTRYKGRCSFTSAATYEVYYRGRNKETRLLGLVGTLLRLAVSAPGKWFIVNRPAQFDSLREAAEALAKERLEG